MSGPAHSVRPTAPEAVEPTHRLPENAFTPDEQVVFYNRSSVDPEAALAWLNGEGPDPWLVESR